MRYLFKSFQNPLLIVSKLGLPILKVNKNEMFSNYFDVNF